MYALRICVILQSYLHSDPAWPVGDTFHDVHHIENKSVSVSNMFRGVIVIACVYCTINFDRWGNDSDNLALTLATRLRTTISKRQDPGSYIFRTLYFYDCRFSVQSTQAGHERVAESKRPTQKSIPSVGILDLKSQPVPTSSPPQTHPKSTYRKSANIYSYTARRQWRIKQ